MPVRITKRAKANESLKPSDALSAAEAVAALKKFKAPKFDQTVNICMHLGIDTAQADQALRGALSLPKGIGKTKRVVAFCQSDVAPKALAAGAIKAGAEELVAEIEKGWMDFDVAIASPDMMRVVSKLGKVLGPKGLMPSPKAGTVATNVPEAVKEYSAGKVEYRADKGGNVHAVIGKMSFPEGDLVANLEHFIHAIEKVRPATAKGLYIKKITISGAMTPGVQIKYVQAVAAE
ncbi:MAG: 50S ribosomal protein L1 [Phycisphaerales bacterium]|jgi:large subunit ribosomal protein L1|nr:50S ribosomal protein L1 [Phycisphaerales bacterium]